ncbi:MAG: PHP domain-containing protein [Candidatus Saganbacteria bacterium]|nr:PHP domain-containing protein [Candidatus Saganbacteria bacterium]
MKIAADLHVHTISSGHAYSTIEEYVARAKKIGLKGFAVTDHGPAMPGAPHAYHFQNMRMIPEKMNGVRIYRGIESNIISADGDIDLPEETFTRLEVVMVAMHPRCGYPDHGEERNTQVLLKALSKNPRINVIAHPGNPKYAIKIRETVAALKNRGIALEINNSSFTSRVGSWERCLEFAREIKRQDGRVILTTDSHISTMLGVIDKSLQIVKEAGLSEKHVINTSLKKIEDFIAGKSV